jgi:RNA polymerase sigma factor (sigma-70 family)
MQTDDELILEIRRGIQSSMEILIRRHYKTVFAYIYRNLGEYHISYDLTQETFVKMIRSIGSYSANGNFQYWLLKIALNTCRDYFKSRGYRTTKESTSMDDSRLESGGSKIIDLIEQKVESTHIRNAVAELPAYQRKPLFCGSITILKQRILLS